MAKLITILAASVGGGLLLGAGIRLGEAIVGSDLPPRRDTEIDGKLAVRLGALEDRLRSLEPENPGLTQTAEVAAIRSQLNRDGQELEALSEISLRLRTELRGWLEESVGARMADVESKLRAESEHSQRQMLDAFVDGVQTRVMNRISRLEEEVSGQSAAMAELRECSLRTEQSIQKLLGGLDRLIIAQPSSSPDTSPPEEPAVQTAPPEAERQEAPEARQPQAASEPPEEPREKSEEPQEKSGEPLAKSGRWRIFG